VKDGHEPGHGPGHEPGHDTARLRVWLRLLRLTRRVGAELRERLRLEFDTTLPQFDVLAALYRSEKGLKMSALSEALMVSNGNVTGIVERLVEQGLVARAPAANDRRVTLVALTPAGRDAFAAMAERHRAWVGAALGGLDGAATEALIALLDAARPEAGA
jgi:DNA-binding MarR family transcriptional regulator